MTEKGFISFAAFGRLCSLAPLRRETDETLFNDNAFTTPTWAIDRQILRRIEPTGVLGRIRNAQNSVLNALLSSARFARMVEQEAVDGSAAYTPADFLATVRKGLWKELDAPQVKVDAYRRNLQHAYLDLVNNKINGAAPSIPAGIPAEMLALLPAAASADEKWLYRAELRSLNASVAVALAKTTDRTSKAHLEGARDQIAKILDPKFAQPASASSNVIRLGIDELETCWPDYIIRP